MCDCLVALPDATAPGVTLFAKNSDRPPDESQRLEWFPPAPPRRSQLRTSYIDVDPSPSPTLGVLGSRPSWMWGLEHGVNEAGVAIGNQAIFTTFDPRTVPPALTGMDLVRLGLERSSTARDAVETIVDLIERYGQGGSGHDGVEDPYWSGFLLADPAEAWVLETSGTVSARERVVITRAVSNRTTIAAFDAEHRDPSMPTHEVTDPRLAAGRAVLARPALSVAALAQHLRTHSSGPRGFSVCMHVPGYAATTASMIVELPAGRRPVAHMLAGAPCRSIYVPVGVGRPLGSPPAWERFGALGADSARTLRSLEAQLAAGAASGATDDDAWAPEAWDRVDAALRALGV